VCRAVGEAQSHLHREDLALVLLHLTAATDEAEVANFVASATARQRPCAVVLLSEEYRDCQAVAFLRAGAADYLGLPIGSGRLTYRRDPLTLRAGIGPRPEDAEAAQGFLKQHPLHFVLAPEMVELMDQIRRVGPQDTTLLFTGETGTGKTRLARLIHE